jgi:hypothetical protein
MFKKYSMAAVLAVAFSRLWAQTPSDPLLMQRGQICLAAVSEYQTWSAYWEGSLLRENANIGTLRTRSTMPMAAVGITRRLNAIVALPYVQTEASQGVLAGQRGWQDLAVWLKWQALDKPCLSGHLGVFAIGGLSTPVSNYVPDFLPMSIGLGATTATMRALVDYRHNSGIFMYIRGSYTGRGNIRIDRDAYQYDGRLYYTNVVPVPNVADAAAYIGWRNQAWFATAGIMYSTGLSGDDMRRNDMPFPTNNMKMTALQVMAKFQPKHFGVSLGFQQVVAGRNMGRSSGVTLGFLYAFHLWNRNTIQ